MKLSKIANLQSGLVLSRKEARAPEETVHVYKRLNIRSLNDYGKIDRDELDVFPAKEKIDPVNLTQTNDIVVRLFMPLNPTVISENDAGLVIPSQLAVIRLHDENVLPEYLCYWLSTSKVSELILARDGWAKYRVIKIGLLAELDIPIIPNEQQNTVVKLVSTSIQRDQLYQKLLQEERKLTALKIQTFIGGNQL